MPLLERSWMLLVLLLAIGEAAAQQPAAAVRLPVRIVEAAGGSDASDRSIGSAQPTPPVAAVDRPLPLAPPSGPRSPADARQRMPNVPNALTTVIASLAVVLGVFGLFAWIVKKANGKGRATLPGAVVETLGRAPLNGRQELQLVRVGNKLLLLAVTPTTAETLTEIADPVEIDRLAGICRHNHPDSITASFREVLSHYAARA